MFENILIPLDGSKLAESVFHFAKLFSEKFGSVLTFIHMIEKNAPEEIHGEKHLRDANSAKEYLEKIINDNFQDCKTVIHVHSTEVGNVAKSIVEHSIKYKSDLIILCKHGKSGMKDIVFGNIAQQVLALGEVPVLIINPIIEKTETFSNILIPLDSDPCHQISINFIKEMAEKFSSSVSLISVIPTYNTITKEWTSISRLSPNATNVMLDLAEEEASNYLNRQKEDLKAVGIESSIMTKRGDPANIIRDYIKETETNLLVLSTHKKIGYEAFWEGSLAAKICRLSNIPLLLIPIKSK